MLVPVCVSAMQLVLLCPPSVRALPFLPAHSEFGLLIKQQLYFDRYTKILAPTLDPLRDSRMQMQMKGQEAVGGRGATRDERGTTVQDYEGEVTIQEDAGNSSSGRVASGGDFAPHASGKGGARGVEEAGERNPSDVSASVGSDEGGVAGVSDGFVPDLSGKEDGEGGELGSGVSGDVVPGTGSETWGAAEEIGSDIMPGVESKVMGGATATRKKRPKKSRKKGGHGSVR